MSEESSKPKFDLNDEQKEAVNHINGPLLVVAGAGSGKTRVIVEKIGYLVSTGLKPSNILAITFTNKAAREMAERIKKNEIEGVWTSTFHSLCVRILKKDYERLGLAENFSIFGTDDQLTIIKAILKEKELDPNDWKPHQILGTISYLKNKNISPSSYVDEVEDYKEKITAQIYFDYERALNTNQAVDFDDLLIKVLELFDKHKDVLERYQRIFKYILVDEYQDTNNVQYQLIRHLSGQVQGLMLTGDPDQSIYSWRGADINNILNFRKDFEGADIIKMEQNYRSLKHILELSNQLVRHNSERYPKDLKSERDLGLTPTLYTLNSTAEEARKVASLILEKKNKHARLSDMAVFYRTNVQSAEIERVLSQSHIPYRIVGGTSYYERAEIKDLIAYLRFVHNPSDNISLMRIVNKPTRGISETTKSKIREFADDNGITCWETMISDSFLHNVSKRAAESIIAFNELAADFFELSFSSPDNLVDKILQTTNYIESYTKKTGEKEQDRIDNINTFVSNIKEFCDNNRGTLLKDYLEHIALDNEKQEKGEENKDEVTLMTLHASKGLEFPYVFFIGLDENLLPHKRSIDDGSNTAIEEERRLCYVGLTRAQVELYLFNARERYNFKEKKRSHPSRFISEMEGEHLIYHKR